MVARDQHAAAHAVEQRVCHDVLHQRLAQGQAAVLLQHVDIAEVSERGLVGHYASEADLDGATQEMRARLIGAEETGFAHLGQSPDW